MPSSRMAKEYMMWPASGTKESCMCRMQDHFKLPALVRGMTDEGEGEGERDGRGKRGTNRIVGSVLTSNRSFSERDWVTLNVGGRLVCPCIPSLSPPSLSSLSPLRYLSLLTHLKQFSTTKSTLTKDPYNMLSRIVSDDWDTLRDPTGAYLIDRPSEYFAPVLHYLRSGSLVLVPSISSPLFSISLPSLTIAVQI